MGRRIVVRAIIALLLLLFVYTASSKLVDLEEFRGNMYNQDLPRWLATTLIWAIPASEIGAAACLLFARRLRTGLIVSLLLLIIYTAYVGAILLHFFRRTPCPCGGIFHHVSWPQHFWFNTLCIALATLALILDSKDREGHLFFHQ
ncbi:MAG TPA: MauE/DoxX family redox-associated membrane protein [Puia sp.]|nr:MauE/DoxX family redox-associated membrane protein [Puia sp.]